MPAYAYPAGPHAVPEWAGATVMQAAASATASAVLQRRDRTTSWSNGGPLKEGEARREWNRRPGGRAASLDLHHSNGFPHFEAEPGYDAARYAAPDGSPFDAR